MWTKNEILCKLWLMVATVQQFPFWDVKNPSSYDYQRLANGPYQGCASPSYQGGSLLPMHPSWIGDSLSRVGDRFSWIVPGSFWWAHNDYNEQFEYLQMYLTSSNFWSSDVGLFFFFPSLLLLLINSIKHDISLI